MKIKQYDIRQCDLHDEKIMGIEIITKNDFFCSINITIEHDNKKVVIKCIDCYSANFNLNMFIKGDDTIRSCNVEDVIVKRKISDCPEKIIDIALKKIILNLNITNSDIEITAREIRMVYYD